MSNLKYKKNWIEGKNKKEKLNLQKNSKHKKKKQRKSIFNELDNNIWNF
jgi:hypothetical protein